MNRKCPRCSRIVTLEQWRVRAVTAGCWHCGQSVQDFIRTDEEPTVKNYELLLSNGVTLHVKAETLQQAEEVIPSHLTLTGYDVRSNKRKPLRGWCDE